MASRWFALLLVLMVMAVASACGGHSGADSALNTPQPGFNNGDLDGVPAMPRAETAGRVNKGTSSYTFVQPDLYASSEASMTGTQLTINDPGAGGVSYAILGVNTGGLYPPRMTINGTLGGLYVGVSDYTHGTWNWLGGVHSSPGAINLPPTGTLSGGGSIYIALVCPAGRRRRSASTWTSRRLRTGGTCLSGSRATTTWRRTRWATSTIWRAWAVPRR